MAYLPNGYFDAVLRLPSAFNFVSDASAYKLPQQTTNTTTNDYTYDPLYRLTAVDYSTGDAYHYILYLT